VGFVRNLPDGRVHVVAEGRPEELDRFLAAIAEQMSDYIRSTTVDPRAATGEFAAFEILH
jgi:acylphosphatase